MRPVRAARGRAVFAALCTLVALTPLPFGSARPLAWELIEVTVGLLLLGQLFIGGADDVARFRSDLAVPLVLGTIFAAYVLVQVSAHTPSLWWNSFWDQASNALGRKLAGTIALDRDAALIDLVRLLSYAGVFYLALALCQDRERAHTAVRLIVASGCIYAIYGLVVYWSGSQTILWYAKWAYADDVTGSFVNRNSFATYLGLCTLAALAQIVTTFGKIRFGGPRRLRVSQALDFASQHWASLLAPFVMITALLLTHSRGGFVATVGGTFVLVVVIALSPSLGRRRRIGWIAVPLALLLAAIFISGGETFSRLVDTDLDVEERFAVYRLTLQAIGDYAIQGSGLGSFASIFPVYRTAAIHNYFDMAHNDYLQTMLEVGIPIALCLFGTITSLVACCVRGIHRRQRDAIYPCLGIAASVLVALHATVDFSLQIPAVTITWVFLLGVAVAQSRSSQDYRPSSIRAA